MAVDEIYAAWWHEAIGIGLALAALCTTTMALCLLARREILRRTIAEGALIKVAERLSVLATTDGLTGLANRRAFEEALTGEWRRAIRAQTSIALLMLDADYFKFYNDRYGHPEGDFVLKSIAGSIIQHGLRSPDMLPAMAAKNSWCCCPRGTSLAHSSSPTGCTPPLRTLVFRMPEVRPGM